MKLYFVRHGETQTNKKETISAADDKLTSLGVKQAEILAKRFSNITVDLVLASPYLRAQKTAEIINTTLKKEIVSTKLLKERKWPKEIEGEPLQDPSVTKLLNLVRDKSLINPKWHYSDEENFFDTKERARLFLDYLNKFSEKYILAVAHEYILKVILAVMMHGESLSYEIFRNFFLFTKLDNTSLTICEKKENDRWRLIVLNDIMHLGEIK
ncbi:MAG: histidine phosphatase family protein [Patescibacteria group bacterium]|nr:histidine phosphatase family protein [Patescibacteria group bacterium]